MSNFGPTKCGEILTEKLERIRKKDARKFRSLFSDYMQIAKELDLVENDRIRSMMRKAIIKHAKAAIYKDIKIQSEKEGIENVEDLKQRLLYCIKFRMRNGFINYF